MIVFCNPDRLKCAVPAVRGEHPISAELPDEEHAFFTYVPFSRKFHNHLWSYHLR